MSENTKLYLANAELYIASDFGDEMILMNLQSGDYVALNAVSADIWKQAEKPINATQIIDHLMENYEVEKEVCESETLTCIEEMLEKQLLIKR